MVENPEAGPPQPTARENAGAFQARTEKARAANGYDRIHQKVKDARRALKRLVPTADHSIAIATWVLAGVTIIALNDARDALHQSQRPWLVATHTELRGPFVAAGDEFSVDLVVSVKNVGNSLAMNTWVWPTIQPGRNGDWRKPCAQLNAYRTAVVTGEASTPGSYRPDGMIIAPGDENNSSATVGSQGAKLSEAQSHDPGAFYIMGCIEYADQFSIHHTTRFCFWRNGPIAADGLRSFVHCNSSETAD